MLAPSVMSEKLVVGFDLTWMNIRDQDGSGIYQYAYRLLSSISERDDVRLVVFVGPTAQGAFKHLEGRNNFREILLTSPRMFLQAIEEEKIRVVHTPMQRLFNLTLRIPLIITLHDVQQFHYPEFFSPDEMNYREHYYRQSAECSERIIVVYNHIKDDLVKFLNIDVSKIDVCPWGIEPPKPIAVSRFNAVRTLYNLPKLYLFYSANTWRHKNHIGLIKALKIVRDEYGYDISLVCTGQQYPDYYPELQRAVSRYNLLEHIVFTGYIPADDMLLILKNAALSVIPTLYEAGSFPLIEAMSYGVPVICSNVTSLPETIGDSRFVFDPTDPQSIAEKIAMMLGDDQLIRDNIDNSKRRCAVMTPELTTESHIDSYRKAVNTFEKSQLGNSDVRLRIARYEEFLCTLLTSEKHSVADVLSKNALYLQQGGYMKRLAMIARRILRALLIGGR